MNASLENNDRELVTRRPDPRLQPHVGDYQGYAETSQVSRTEVPSGIVPLIFSVGVPLRANGESFGSFLAGMHDTHTLTEWDGAWRGVQLNFTPIGAYLLLGQPMSEIANRIAHLDDLFREEGALLDERLHAASTWDACFDIIEAFVLHRMARARPASRAVLWAWNRIRETKGRVSIASLADQVGWSRKHLNRKFQEQVGLAPKVVARIARFNHACEQVATGRSWTDVAFAAGYYDQAHLTRDFRQFAGATPKEFAGQLAASPGR